MTGPNPHTAFVEAWLQQVTRSASPPSSDQLLGLLEQALGALWREAEGTLGEVTLTAIASRVLHVGKERYPPLVALSLDAGGFSVRELRERADSLQNGELLEATRFLLVEFLRVLGSLTAEILTPWLHAELSNVKIPDAARPCASSEPPSPLRTGTQEGEDA
jgi:hypothetical protein